MPTELTNPDSINPDGTVAGPPPLRSARSRKSLWLATASVPLLIGAAWFLFGGLAPGLFDTPAGLRQSLMLAAGFFSLIALELAVIFLAVSVLLGLLQEYVGVHTIKRLVPDGVKGSFVAAGLGGLTPFCSCSTIPVMLALLDAGVGFGPSASFLIASPLVDPMVLILLWLAFGWPAMLLYTALTLLLAVLLGLAWARFGLASQVRTVRITGMAPVEGGRHGFRDRLAASLINAARVFRAFLPNLLLGALIGSLIYGFVPENWVISVAGRDNPLAVPTAALIGIPLYIPVDTMIPIGLALYGKGMSVGAVIALVISAAGTSIPELILLNKIFKPRLLVVFTITVFLIAIISGYFFEFFYSW
jgi:uncharacterized protein